MILNLDRAKEAPQKWLSYPMYQSYLYAYIILYNNDHNIITEMYLLLFYTIARL